MFYTMFRNAIRDTSQSLMSTAVGLGFYHGGKMFTKKANPDLIKIKPETDALSVTKRS